MSADMKKVTRRFVQFFSPGAFVAEMTEVRIDNADPNAIKWPDFAYAFTMHERIDIVDGEDTYTGKTKQVGKTYYHPDSKVETFDEVSLNPAATKTLLSNMKHNGWKHIVWSRWGDWPQPFNAETNEVLSRENIQRAGGVA